MQSSEQIEIPDIIPVMTLQETVLFPHAVVPLYIFEERYRTMLKDVLTNHRLFAIFKESDVPESDSEEPPESMGTVGVVRAAHANPDGTSNLALQGIARVRLLEVVQEFPYRMVRVEVCHESTAQEEKAPLRKHIIGLLDRQPALTNGLPDEYLDFLRSLDEPHTFIDVAIHSICTDCSIKQELLETLCLEKRYRRFENYLLRQQDEIDLFERLQGKTRDDEIELN
jgi:ATP-dependent Lon protease